MSTDHPTDEGERRPVTALGSEPGAPARGWGAAEGGVVLAAIGITQALLALALPWYRMSGSLEPTNPDLPVREPVEQVWQGWSLGAQVTVGDVTLSGSSWLSMVAVIGTALLVVLGLGVLVGKRGVWVGLLAVVAFALFVVSFAGVEGEQVSQWEFQRMYGADAWRMALAMTLLGAVTRWWAAPDAPTGPVRYVGA